MSTPRERILIVESDPEISDLIGRQALRPLGYQVRVVGMAQSAIQDAVRLLPDVMIVDLNLPGLSGKDLLVALSSQGVNVPIIVIAEEGLEGDVIQAFRLGASDYLRWPVREAEVVSAVERALTQVRSRRDRERLAGKLEKTNHELQRRVRELTTIFGVGKAVTSITDKRQLFDKIIEGAVYVAEAEKGWLLLRQGDSKSYILSAAHNLPKSVQVKIGQPWDDGISSLVALSGETLAIHGDPLKRFKIFRLGKSALVVPVKAQKEVVGLLVVIREAATPFNPSNQAMVEAVADYASISLVNSRLFEALESRAHSLQMTVDTSKESGSLRAEMLQNVSKELKSPLDKIQTQVEALSKDNANFNPTQVEAIGQIQKNLTHINDVINALTTLQKASIAQTMATVNLVDLGRQALERNQNLAQQNDVTLVSKLPAEPLFVTIDMGQVSNVFDTLLTNAVGFAPKGGQVTLEIDRPKDGMIHASVEDTGQGIPDGQLEQIFQPFYQLEDPNGGEVRGLGISLALAKEAIRAHGGKMWAQHQTGSGTVFHFTLRPADK